jgi:hypothetical protein
MPTTRPRLLWAYDHPAARYQETNLYLDAGFEVVVSLGDPNTLRYDTTYHNETHYLYPDWRSSCTLPQYVVERLRRISLTNRVGLVSDEEARLINETIDVMIIPADPPVIQNIMTWFKGFLLYRVNGAVNRPLLFENLKKIDAVARQPHCRDRFYLAPGMKNLIPTDVEVLNKNVCFINVWVSPERLFHRWAGRESLTEITTGISYIDFHNFFYGQYLNFQKHITAVPYTVLGKNDKKSARCASASIMGAVDADVLYGRIAKSRLFADAVNVPEHLIFPPLEAMQMDVPVIYVKHSGLGAVGADEGYSDADLEAAGMVKDFTAMNAFLATEFSNFNRLHDIAARQRSIFMDHIFSRDVALRNVQAFVDIVQRAKRPTFWKKLSLATAERAFGLVFHDKLPRRPVTDELSYMSAKALTHYGRSVYPHMMRGQAGRVITETSGMTRRECRAGRDKAGFIALDFLPPLAVGTYDLTMHIDVKAGQGQALSLAVGTWAPEGYSEVSANQNINGSASDLATTVTFAITEGSETHRRELRFYWHGIGELSFTRLHITMKDGAVHNVAPKVFQHLTPEEKTDKKSAAA